MRLKYFAACICIVFSACVYLRFTAQDILMQSIPSSRVVYSSSGELLRLSLTEDDIFRLWVNLDNISDSAINATLYYEDRYFRYHPGFNPASLARGVISYVGADRRPVGGSTITMQLARRLYSLKTTTIKGKIKQIFYAIYLEIRYSKDNILEAYLNTAPYGHNIEGIGAASLIYFNKQAFDLSMIEGFTICVIPQNPVKRVPTTDSGYANMKRARDQLIVKWLKSHPEKSNLLNHAALDIKVKKIKELPFVAPHFVNTVLKNSSDTELYSTLDITAQKLLEESISEFVSRYEIYGIRNASAMLVNTDTMYVLAAAGSADFFNDEIQGQVNGLEAMRSPGSLLKPFIYAKALDGGLIHPRTLLKDSPRRYGLYSPENSDRGFMGPVFAQDALVDSRNIPAVDLLIEIGGNSFVEMLRKGGVQRLKDYDYYGASIALGGLEISAEDAARLYSSLNNGGVAKPLKYLKNSENKNPAENIMSAEAAYIVRDMLKSNPPVYMDGIYDKLPVKVAWKTGTSFRFRDAWSAGVFSNYALVVWVGNFNNEPNNAFKGRQVAGTLFFGIINKIVHTLNLPQPAEEIPQGLNLKYIDICAVTGELPAEFCPKVIPTLFIPGVSPVKQSEIYQKIPVDKKTGLRACYYDPDTSVWEVYEVWPYDMLQLFEKAGLSKKSPPPFMPGCRLDTVSNSGAPPEITYPSADVIYDITNSPQGSRLIPFTASLGSDAQKMFWFVDGALAGVAEKAEPFFWQAERGRHNLTVVDDLGRSGSLFFEVI